LGSPGFGWWGWVIKSKRDAGAGDENTARIADKQFIQGMTEGFVEVSLSLSLSLSGYDRGYC
jgi:hypothetical protein